MNYLAHILLSGKDRQLQVGNFIGDFVKGKNYQLYPKGIQEGILFHREIDGFTDAHPAFKETITYMRPTFGRYSGVMADMFYDYLLANNFKTYHASGSLTCFTYNFYLSTLYYYRWLPEQVKGFIFHFIATNRLHKYASYEGLYSSLSIMSRVKAPAINPDASLSFLQANEAELLAFFKDFMPELLTFASDYTQNIPAKKEDSA